MNIRAMYVHGIVSNLEEQLIMKLNVAHGNVSNAKRAFDTLLEGYQKNYEAHNSKVERIQGQICMYQQLIYENIEEIYYLSDPTICEINVKNEEPPVELDIAEYENNDLMIKTDAELSRSYVVQDQIARIEHQHEHDKTVYEEQMREIEYLAAEVDNKTLALENYEKEYINSLYAIDAIITGKTRINSVKSGRYSSLGYRKDAHDTPRLQDLIGRINSGVDMLLKQMRQIELEKAILERKLADY